MDTLWSAASDCTGRTVADAIEPHAYTTVATVLERLTRKGLVDRRREGHRILYRARGSRAIHSALRVRRVLDDADDRDATLDELSRLLSGHERDVLGRSLRASRRRHR